MERILSWQWTGFTQFTSRINVVRGKSDEDSTKVQAWPESLQKGKQQRADEKLRLDTERRLGGIHNIDLEDKEFNET